MAAKPSRMSKIKVNKSCFFLFTGDISKNDLQVLAKRVNSWRSVILSEMKEGLIMIPSYLQDMKDAAKDSTSPLFVFVKSLFDSHSKGIS